MTFATAVHILFTSFVYPTNVYLSVIHGIKRKPHLSVVWNWYHFVAIANLHQPRPSDSADINTRLQLGDTSSIPPMHGGFLLGLPSRGHLTNDFVHHDSHSREISLCSHPPSDKVITTTLCTRHDSYDLFRPVRLKHSKINHEPKLYNSDRADVSLPCIMELI